MPAPVLLTMMRIALICMLLLGGCALFPLSEADCRPASWYQRGYDDGFGGNYRQDLRYTQECAARYSAQVPTEEYLDGWRDGHREWDRLMGSFHKTR